MTQLEADRQNLSDAQTAITLARDALDAAEALVQQAADGLEDDPDIAANLAVEIRSHLARAAFRVSDAEDSARVLDEEVEDV